MYFNNDGSQGRGRGRPQRGGRNFSRGQGPRGGRDSSPHSNYERRSQSCNPSGNHGNRRGSKINNRNRSGRRAYQHGPRGHLQNQPNYPPFNENIQPLMQAGINPDLSSLNTYEDNASGQNRMRRSSINQSTSNCAPVLPSGIDEPEGSSRQRQHKQRRTRQYVMGYKKLEEVLSASPDDIIFDLLNENSGFKLLVEDSTLINNENKVILSIKVLSRARLSSISTENWMQLIDISFCPTFKNSLVAFITVKTTSVGHSKYQEFFNELFCIIDKFFDIRPFATVDKFEDILKVSAMVLNSDKNFAELFKTCTALQEKLNETKTQLLAKKKENRLHDFKHLSLDDSEPPDDFREISVLPTAQDISMNEFPFLRRNVIEGRYKDDDHYLDVQFRLLREDFVRPLRLGIADHRECKIASKKSRNRDISIYTKVSVESYELVKNEFAYYVKINFPKSFNFENSRRLMYGNLVCFSDDNFKTLHFGYIFDRSIEKFKKGEICVKFDSNPVTLGKKYEMAESRAYFVAFKYVLEALQSIKRVPLPHYLLYVSHDLHHPSYFGPNLRYDIKVIRFPNMLRKEEAKGLFMRQVKNDEQDNDLIDFHHPLSSVSIVHPIHYFPNSDSLQLDDSQRKALHGALTRQLAIIQGPPGTGKTFLGLKITQILLHNRHQWVDPNEKAPILVVCYTNHALDQFLEGMLAFTQNIVRVGSRSKNENLRNFQIKELCFQARRHKWLPAKIHHRNLDLNSLVEESHNQLVSENVQAKELRNPDGILALEVLKSVIPNHFLIELQQIGLTKWLCVDVDDAESFQSSFNMDLVNEPKESEENQEGLDEDEWHDVQEFVAEQESSRLIDIDVDVTFTSRKIDVELMYETRFSKIQQEINELIPFADQAIKFPNEENMSCYYKFEFLKNWLDLTKNAMNIAKKLMPKKIKEITKSMDYVMNFSINHFLVKQRWLIYQYWVEELLKNVNNHICLFAEEHKKKCKAQEEVRNQEHLLIMKSSAVVGMTTTGAAQYTEVLKALNCQIVIIEEAAEILESHIVTSLTEKCEHLIMIGDHQQLRPSTTVYELATKYNLETSLFERLIKNGVMFNTLEYQHRMRPEISALLVPAIYPDLKDNPTVHGRPNIEGIDKNIFFIDHKIHEDKKEENSTSYENSFEASFIMALCRHILLQGYSTDQITILTPYIGQFFLLKKKQRSHQLCSDVKICVVDNFQGEENDIILLSLVRSNEQSNVGFLKVDNRVNVALSRAKNGMYIMGNMDQLCSKSKLWVNIKETLESQNSIGSFLPLRCVNHPDILTEATNAEVFNRSSPEGGCNLQCSYNFSDCGHPCTRICHVRNMDHKNARCTFPCLRKQCDNDDHLCQKKCFEDCGPCMRIVDKHLDCGHVAKDKCHLTPNKIKCLVLVERPLPHCLHVNKMECYQSVNTFPCTYDCETRLDCGHKCKNRCHKTNDPDHLEYNCYEDCTEFNKGCVKNHACSKRCFEECGLCFYQVTKKLPCGHESKNVKCHLDPQTIQCSKPCSKKLPCGHKCSKKCFEDCGDCKIKVRKLVVSCGHEVQIECRTPPTSGCCAGKCPKVLSCGHPCKNRCKEQCSQMCGDLVSSNFNCPKKHPIKIPCHQLRSISKEEAQLHCKEACHSTLSCGHNCKGKCGECLFGRIHKPCQEKCGKTLVCGHICKSPCSFECPPCREMCEFKCTHSKCKKMCGIPCTPCKMECSNTCEHKEVKSQKCNRKCGYPCSTTEKTISWTPCDQPCPKTIRKCDHDCIGFCGDPCPKQCRICDQQELTEFFLIGNESDGDARFVLLPDCNHAIEVEGLEHWLNTDNGEIGMKKCPRCQNPIYNLRRYSNIILRSYKNVEAVKKKYFTKNKTEIKNIKTILGTIQRTDLVSDHVRRIERNLGLDVTMSERKRKQLNRNVPDNMISLSEFQATILKQISDMIMKIERGSIDLTFYYRSLITILMSINERISNQIANEITAEVQRIAILPSVEKLKKNCFNTSVQQYIKEIDQYMDLTVPFTADREKKVKESLGLAKRFVGGLNIPNEERKMILSAMGLSQGHWYKCKNNHIYCITECGGAMEASVCPECKEPIGGSSHQLHASNAVATEMDGSRHAAWSEQANLGNYDF